MKKMSKKAFVTKIIKLVIFVFVITLLVFLIKHNWNVDEAFSDISGLLGIKKE